MNASIGVSASGKYTLTVDPGGDNGEYTATYVRVRLPPPLRPTGFYSAKVTASASGGVPPYEFRWSDRPAGATARSQDESVVLVDVSSPGIRVSGVGAGETLVEVGTDDGKLYLPVVVR